MRKTANELVRLLVVAAAILIIAFVLDEVGRRQVVRVYLFRFPGWTWTINVAVKVAAMFFLGNALYRSLRQVSRSITLKVGLGLVLLALLFQAASITVGTYTPLRLDGAIIGVGLSLLGLSLSRERKEKSSDLGTVAAGPLTVFVEDKMTQARLNEMIEKTDAEQNKKREEGDDEHV